MSWANGSTQTKNGPVFLEWRTDRMHVWLNAHVPSGYRIQWQLPDEWNSRPEWIINGVVVSKQEREKYI